MEENPYESSSTPHRKRKPFLDIAFAFVSRMLFGTMIAGLVLVIGYLIVIAIVAICFAVAFGEW